MSLKAELETWGAALQAYDEQDYSKSIGLFDRIADTSKILFNVGIIYATIGEHELAVANLKAACGLDKHLAIGYFQTGVSNFLLKKYETAYKDFEEALFHLRSNQFIDYDQLGLKFQLWRPEILFNKGLCQIYMGNVDFGMRDLEAANKDKTLEEHDVIAAAILERGQGYTVFSIPVGVLYRPSESKLKNVKAKDYMGQAKLIAASESKDAFTDFTGVKLLQEGLGPAGQRLDRPPPASQQSQPMPSQTTATSRSATPIYEAMSTTRTNSPVPSFRPDPPPKSDPGKTPISGSQTGSASGMLGRATTITFAASPEKSRSQTGASATSNSTSRSGSADESTSNSGNRGPPPSSFRPEVSGVPGRARTNSASSPSDRDGSVDRRRPTMDTLIDSQRRPSQQSSPLRNERPTPVRSATVDDTGRRPSARIPEPVQVRSRSRDPKLRTTRSDYDPNLKPRGGVTQFYDEYLDVYGTSEPVADPEPEPEVEIQVAARRVLAWNTKTPFGASPDVPPSRVPSQAVQGQRASPRRIALQRGAEVGSNGSASQYEDDERSGSTDMTWKIRVKIHYKDETRGMALTFNASFEDLKDMVVLKFGILWTDLMVKFSDEDGGKISLKDEMDWDMALEVARGTGDGLGKPEGRLEMWLTER